MTFGAIAAGSAVAALAGCAAEVGLPRFTPALRAIAAAVPALLLATQLVESAWWEQPVARECRKQKTWSLRCERSRWSPAPLVPTAQDKAAGDKLIARLSAVDGDVFMPYHPWYPHLAGKPTYVHRMGIVDLTTTADGRASPYAPKITVPLRERLRNAAFGAVVLNEHAQTYEYVGLTEGYRVEARLGADETPRVYSGAKTVPRTVWLPNRPEPLPEGTTVRFDFEAAGWGGWQVTGKAWGAGPVRSAPKKQVGGYRGKQFAASLTGAEAATGTVVSPAFAIAQPRLVLRVGGGKDAKLLRVELRLAATGAVVRSATGPRSEIMQTTEWDVADLRGRSARLALVDESAAAWGWLAVDDVWEVGPAAPPGGP
jgi:hypothetical protein